VLHLARKIRGATIRAVDGDIGTVEDFYFEEDRWTVRYLLVDTGKWMSGKKVLLSPMSVGEWNAEEIRVSLNKNQVWDSPEFNPQGPFSHDHEKQVLGYYGYPYYWGAAGVWGMFDEPAALLTAPAPPAPDPAKATGIDPESRSLRSTHKSTGYHLRASDGEVGHVDDFLIGDKSWRIRYLLVDTSNWIGGRSVIVSSEALERVDKQHAMLHVGVTRDAIKQSPSFESIESALDTRETGPPFVFI
jgi:uncharacterized protein YrrD